MRKNYSTWSLFAKGLNHNEGWDPAWLGAEPKSSCNVVIGKASVYAHREGPGHSLLIRRSFADYIWRYFVRAAAPYGLGITHLEASTQAGGAGT